MSNALSESLNYWYAGGPLLIPIAIVCFGIWIYFLKTRRSILQAINVPKGWEDALVLDLTANSQESMIRKYESMQGAFPDVITYVLKVVRNGGKAGQAFEEFEQNTLNHLQRDLVVLTALTAVAPLLGLLGTVAGMIETFRAVAESTGETAGKVASGISQALITTQFGLVVAIPGVFGIARLDRMIDQLKTMFASCKIHLLLAMERRVI